MNTPTHLLVAAALLARPGRKQVNRGALVGALLPDLSLYVLVAAAAAQGFSFKTIFDELYFSQSWQSVFAIDNSAPLYAALLCAGLLARQIGIYQRSQGFRRTRAHLKRLMQGADDEAKATDRRD